jgi:hypothetical protein
VQGNRCVRLQLLLPNGDTSQVRLRVVLPDHSLSPAFTDAVHERMCEFVLPIGVKRGKVAAPARAERGKRGVNEPQQTRESGWSAGKVLGLIFGLLVMVGFGVCGLCGLVMSVSERNAWTIALPMGIPGVVIAFCGFLLVRRMVRAARRQTPPTP